MAIVVGQSVRGEDFWNRENEVNAIWDAIDAGNHILLAAPRRVGKTSIMYKLLDEPRENYILIYVDTEAAYSENEFWHKLFYKLIDQEFIGTLQAKAKHLWKKLAGIKIKKVSTSGVEFGDGETLDYASAFKKLLQDLENDHKIIVMLDEFAQTIENITKFENAKSALHLLSLHRELRQDDEFSKKVTFIYAGSIGLESVVAKMGATRHINDLNSIKIHPLSFPNAEAFTSQLCRNNGIAIDDATIKVLLEKIEWLIPFYIQLIAQEIKKLNRSEVTCNDIDTAIKNALQHRNHFEHWLSKIREAFERDDFLFAKEVLNTISENLTIDSAAIQNIAVKYGRDEESNRETIHALVYDGYINNNDDARVYRFNSPILRMWWSHNVAN